MPLSLDRKSTRLNSSHGSISYAVFCLKKKKTHERAQPRRLPSPPSRDSRHVPLSHRRRSAARRRRTVRGQTRLVVAVCFFFFNDTATTEIYTLSLHDALPISPPAVSGPWIVGVRRAFRSAV